jgi:VIT1/CCC1 family predicted Fe2+/Mn2+ transporter
MRSSRVPDASSSLARAGATVHGEAALGTLAREELGLDQEALGSPWLVAASSAISFASGAIVPVLPYFFALDRWTSNALSATALTLVGLGLSLVTGRNPVSSGATMLLVRTLVASVMVGIGRLIGISTS